MKKKPNKIQIVIPPVAICRECEKEVLSYQTIHTKRKTKIYICNECLKKIKGGGAECKG